MSSGGVIETDATGTGDTVTVAVAVSPEPVAVTVITACPCAPGVTKPVPLTAATPVLFVLNVTGRPAGESVPPMESRSVTASCVPASPCVNASASGATTTRRTGTSETVTCATPETEPLVPVIVALPGALAVTSPPPLAVATPVLLDPHVTV